MGFHVTITPISILFYRSYSPNYNNGGLNWNNNYSGYGSCYSDRDFREDKNVMPCLTREEVVLTSQCITIMRLFLSQNKTCIKSDALILT